MLENPFAQRGQESAFLAALKKGLPDLFLELFDLVAESGLSDVTFLGRTGETPDLATSIR